LLLLLFGIGLGFLVFSLVDDKQSSIAFVQDCSPITVTPNGNEVQVSSRTCTYEEILQKFNYFSDGATPYERQNFYVKAIFTLQDGNTRTLYRQLSNIFADETNSFDTPPPWTLSSIPVVDDTYDFTRAEYFILEGDIGTPPVNID
jgi:hypothetical protein